jgi:hypothetical protein
MTTIAQAEVSGARTPAAGQLFAAAWMAVALGFALELLSAVGAFALEGGTTLQAFLASAAQRVSWSTIVCVGLAFAKAFAPANTGASAWAGMLAAPTAFTVSRAVHKGVAQAIGLAAASPPLPLFLLLTTLKSLEYGILGAWLTRIDARDEATLGRYAGAGLVVGFLFGGAALAATALFSPRSPGAADWFARAINELLFPMGCAFVLYAAGLASRKLSA